MYKAAGRVGWLCLCFVHSYKKVVIPGQSRRYHYQILVPEFSHVDPFGTRAGFPTPSSRSPDKIPTEGMVLCQIAWLCIVLCSLNTPFESEKYGLSSAYELLIIPCHGRHG